jgi:hypothetical protein
MTTPHPSQEDPKKRLRKATQNFWEISRLKFVTFNVRFGAAFRRNKIECLTALVAVVFLVFAFLYVGRAAFWAAFLDSWRLVFLHSLA